LNKNKNKAFKTDSYAEISDKLLQIFEEGDLIYLCHQEILKTCPGFFKAVAEKAEVGKR